jgi:hypothetical protein
MQASNQGVTHYELDIIQDIRENQKKIGDAVFLHHQVFKPLGEFS